MEEMISPSCPTTVTVRRNPHRRARPTPLNTAAAVKSPSTLVHPIQEISSLDLAIKPSIPQTDSLKVFLRLCPLPKPPKHSKSNHLKPKTKNKTKTCVTVTDAHSVTISPPCDSTRLKSELYNGFSRVFSSDSSQDEVYEKLMEPIVEEFIEGKKSGLLAALGPSGSGKTHTVFGTANDPGLVPRALRRIFEPGLSDQVNQSRSFYLSMFEIYSEKGKGEKLYDLSQDGANIYMQQSVIKGLKEVLVTDVAQAESLLAQAKSKRATAMTKSNSQSSRSQCIINIRYAVDKIDAESDSKLNGAVLTFVDLAGAEREKKTGNQGGRLLESNFINNTSMVFGLCLRSLLEHQKNPKKPLQKHFQSSLLTRYLRDYLEGRKRMALILTARSGEEDYFDTSYLLRQASPYMEIKFHNVEETSNLPGNKRRYQTKGSEQQKKVKLSDADTCRDYVGKTIKDSDFFKEPVEALVEQQNDLVPGVKVDTTPKANCTDVKIEREFHVMQGFAKALWNAMKQYKERVKTMQKDIDVLTENLKIGRDRYLMVEKELSYLKSKCSCHGEVVSEERYKVIEQCSKKRIINPPGEKGSSHSQHVDTGVITPEDHNHSTSQGKETKLLLKTIVHKHSESEETETLESEVRCQSKDFERRVAEKPDSDEQDVYPGSQSVPCVSDEHQDPGSTDISKVRDGDCSTSARIPKSVDKNSEPSQGASAPSNTQESYQENHLLSDCDILHHISANDSNRKYSTKNVDNKGPIDGAACSPQLHAMDLIVQGERSRYNKDTKKDKENVEVGPGSNFNSELETKQTIQSRPLNAERRKRRLMPASSLLLRDVSGMDIADESEKHKRGRGGQRIIEDESKQTKGNASLYRLLKSQLPS